MGRIIALGFLVFLAVACSQEDMLKKIAPQEQQDIARSYIDQLRACDFADIQKALDPSLAS
ncbi:MAG TPA: hypothetical protein VGD63_09190, partial [Steroidobacteraceae bacterium]